MYGKPTIRVSDLACQDLESTEKFIFPTETMLDVMLASGDVYFLAGIESNEPDNTGWFFNFIFSNGKRSTQRDQGEIYHDHMIPADAHSRIRSIIIYYGYDYIDGFSFFDKQGLPIWK